MPPWYDSFELFELEFEPIVVASTVEMEDFVVIPAAAAAAIADAVDVV